MYKRQVYNCCPITVYGVSFLINDDMLISIDTYGAHKVVLEDVETGTMSELSKDQEEELYRQLNTLCLETFGLSCEQLLEKAKNI